MNLQKLIRNIKYTSLPAAPPEDLEITYLCYDSRRAVPGAVFVCLTGALNDGHAYASEAYAAGCRVFICQKPLHLPGDAFQLITADTRIALALASAEFFSHPADKLEIIGITGTKGKTTTALLIYQILEKHNISAGYIGSNGVMYGPHRLPTVNTTPESYDLHYYFDKMQRDGVKYVVMEVSSQALSMSRVHGIGFSICLFTNLTRDHIGPYEHPDFTHYKNAKISLFRDYKCNCIIYNNDDPHSPDIIRDAGAIVRGYSVGGDADFTAENITLLRRDGSLGVAFDCVCAANRFEVNLNFPGRFSVYNALAAIAVCTHIGLPTGGIAHALDNALIRGRFEPVKIFPYCTFIIDYAHNGNSLRSALEALRQYNPARLICVFGSVGGRTHMRRAELGAAASEMADLCVLTADDPNYEPAENIISDIIKGFGGNNCVHTAIPDRTKAIEYVVREAKPGDIILLAGKGHEDFQLIRGRHVPFDEREILIKAAENIE